MFNFFDVSRSQMAPTTSLLILEFVQFHPSTVAASADSVFALSSGAKWVMREEEEDC